LTQLGHQFDACLLPLRAASSIKLREPAMPDGDAGLTTLQGARTFLLGGYDPLLAPFWGTVNVSRRFRPPLPERSSQQRKHLAASFANAKDHFVRDFRDAKAMAQTLREALKAKSVSLTHSESLELIAKTLGLHDWNELAARIRASQPAVSGTETLVPTTNVPPTSTGAVVPIIPLRDLVLFPQMVRPIFVGRAKTMRAIKRAMATDSRVLVATQKRAGEDDPALDALYPVGVTANVVDRQTLPDGTFKIFVEGLQRTAIVRLVDEEYLAAELAPIKESRGLSAEALSLSQAVLGAYRIYANVDFSSLTLGPEHFRLPSIGDPGLLADSVAPLLSIEIERKQQLLETSDVVARLEMILDLMKAGRSTT
jgi:Lon protease-like protein